ncbi:MAG: hypothetical protein GC150_15570 [Rhizobiales bacterium]|nr:hypothetical protein [Hyphomicrobiales bacterium]
MGNRSEAVIAGIRAQGAVSAGDVLALRRAFYEDGAISVTEAEALLDIEATADERDPSWAPFFIEALTDFTVHQVAPAGYVSAENADWLIARITADGQVRTASELELVISIADAARWVPERLTRFALAQVKDAVLGVSGPLADGRGLEPGVIGAAEVDLIRRILYAAGGDGNIAITRAEAEILFDINDATREAENHPSWSDLFVKAVANHLMAAAGYAPPTREEALRLEEWLEERGSVSDFLGSMFSGGFRAVWEKYREQSAEERALERLTEQRRQILLAEEVTSLEASWLAARIGRDGVLHENERALLRFIKQECPQIDPALSELLAAA